MTVLLAVVGLRPLISESFHTRTTALASVLPGTRDPSPAHTLILDALIIIVSLAWLLLARHRRTRVAMPLVKLGIACWLVGVVISCVLASEPRPAINATLDMAAAFALAAALYHVIDTTRQAHVALCVIVASACANVGQSAESVLAGFDDTEAVYMENREAIWQQQNVPLDSAQVRLFEARMRAREAAGFFAHSNVAGGYLVLTTFVALALTIAAATATTGGMRWAGILCGGLITVATIIGIGLSGSRGAWVALVAGFALVVLRWVAFDWLLRRRRAIGWGAAAALIVITGAVITYGQSTGKLPGTSLLFRWQYWSAAAQMFQDHMLTGVGAENFGDHYLVYKSITSPEEVSNPHNLFVQFATECDLFGLVRVLLIVIGGARRLTQPPPREWLASEPKNAQLPGRQWIAIAAALTAIVFLPRIALLPSHEPNYVIWSTVFPMLVWLPAFLLLATATQPALAKRRVALIASAIINCGIFAFLLQDMINFAFFVPAARTTVLAVGAISLALRKPVDADVTPAAATSGWRRMVSPGAFIAAVVVVLVLVVPPIRAERALRDARRLTTPSFSARTWHQIEQHYRDATRLDPLDATAPAEHARWIVRIAPTTANAINAYRAAVDAINVALARAPMNASDWRLKAKIHLHLYEATNQADQLEEAIAAYRHALRLYPTRPQSHVQLGDCLARSADTARLQEAVQHYRQALDLDDHRPASETIRRMSADQRAAIKARIKNVQTQIKATGSP